ncbi:uncharacterized protein H6S33_006999 [Morchella sextelata]|uniref:uncharacterized protein n=1 Tax=Morchella sextelata TaxID=1174677 RepID=UPI001D055818|nr:uncharacterized protein H6S33_006999 [Morchella sextelata]KAH0603968.1 hypothetical protein H6S33_006999 [Morchella sextelata]
MPQNRRTPADLDALTLRQQAELHAPPHPANNRGWWEDPPSPPSPTGPTGTDTPWWPSWHAPLPRPLSWGAADLAMTPRHHADDERIMASFLREREARLESVDHLLSFAAPPEEEADAEAAAAEVTLLGTAQLLETLAGELVAGGEAERAWAGVDAALTALVVLGCGGARVGAVGVGACVLCYATVANVVLRPCGHLVMCLGCVLREKVGGKGAGKRRQAVCPVPECGKAVEETVKTYRG